MTRNSRFLPPLLLGWAALVACSSPPFHGGDPQSAPEGGAAGDGGFVGAGSAPLAGGAGIGSSAGVGSNAGVGGAPGTAGSSGVTALAGASGSSSGEPCPVLAGEPMLRVGSYCIDKNEVTVDSYQAFLANLPALPTLPECSWNDSYKPACTFATDVSAQVVRCIDWCDAYEYCHSVGKRLCGAIDGGASSYGETGDALGNQWFAACTGPSQSAYPYGDSYDAKACVGADAGHSGPLVTSDAPACEGGYPGLTGMSGNVAEWVDSCSGTNGTSDHCRLRGGSVMSTSDQLTCANVIATQRNLTSQTIGFRCCTL